LNHQVSFLSNTREIDFVFANALKLDEEGNVIGHLFTSDMLEYSSYEEKFENQLGFKEGLLEHLLLKNFICMSTVVVRRKCFQRSSLFDPKLKNVYDLALWLNYGKTLSVWIHEQNISQMQSSWKQSYAVPGP